jgi:N-acetylglucosamine-6-sulfatase
MPTGFDAWFANGGGDYFSPRFQVRNLQHLGYADGAWQGGSGDYSTSIIGNVSLAWVHSVAQREKPFFAYIAVKAAHEPFTPAPWYTEHWEESWPTREPRPPNWNCSVAARSRHHGCIASAPMLTAEAAAVITGSFQNRWRTLLSLDDLVKDVYTACEDSGVADRTYFVSTSDHGFQLGQLNIPMDKRHVYDWDTRIPLVIRGPGIPGGSRLEQPATLVDLAPTFLSMAGLPKPSTMDGRSLLPLLVDTSKNDSACAQLLPATQRHLRDGRDSSAPWRDSVFFTHFFYTENTKCVANCTSCSAQCHQHDSNCADSIHGLQCWSTLNAHWTQDPTVCTTQCYPTETRDNNFVALRHTPRDGSSSADTLYAEFHHGQLDEHPIDFRTPPNHVEYFDSSTDPWMMHNLHGEAARVDEEKVLQDKLRLWLACKGNECP